MSTDPTTSQLRQLCYSQVPATLLRQLAPSAHHHLPSKMSDHVRKLCLLGDSGVGKSALAARLGASPAARPDGLWVHYWTAPEGNIPCALWDLRGRSSLDSLSQAFLAHADGFALIADAGNQESIQLALQVGQMAAKLIGERPQVLILNQFDGAVSSAEVAAELAPHIPAFVVSAGTGEGVEAAFGHLAQAVS